MCIGKIDTELNELNLVFNKHIQIHKSTAVSPTKFKNIKHTHTSACAYTHSLIQMCNIKHDVYLLSGSEKDKHADEAVKQCCEICVMRILGEQVVA